MASTDWLDLGGTLAAGVVRGTTDSPPSGVPNGGGTFSHGMGRTSAGADGVVGLYHSAGAFVPTPKGGSIMGAMIRNGKNAETGNNLVMAPMLFANLQGLNTTDLGYLIGMTEEENSRIILAKGAPTAGLDAAVTGMLRLSSATYARGTWLHLRLDVIEQPSGDVLLKVFQSPLATAPVTAPAWAAVAGMADYVDDALAYNTGTVPLLGGQMGFAARMGTEAGRYMYFDHVQPQKDNTP